MYTDELLGVMDLDRCLKKIKTNVFAANTIPKKKKNGAFIINTQNANQLGQHWVAVFIPKNAPPEYFDSYGRDAPTKFQKFIGMRYKYNPYKFQGPLSDTCGLHCLHYLAKRCQKIKPHTILESIPIQKADDFVTLWFLKTYAQKINKKKH